MYLLQSMWVVGGNMGQLGNQISLGCVILQWKKILSTDKLCHAVGN